MAKSYHLLLCWWHYWYSYTDFCCISITWTPHYNWCYIS